MADDKNQTHYFLDGNPKELERLRIGQRVIRDYVGKLVLAPVNFDVPGLKILDSATADGLWLQELRDSISSPRGDTHTLIGTDITSIYFPRPQPEGISLYEQSMTQPWPEHWAESFDLVHQRMALPAADKATVHKTLRDFVRLVKPGGWIQLVEPDHSVYRGPGMASFFQLLSDVFAFMGTGTDYARQLRTWMEAELGLVHVEERIFDVPLGKASTSDEMGLQSAKMISLVVDGLIQVAKDIPTSFPPEALNDLGPRIQDELRSSGGIFRLHFVWGRKPPV